MSGMEEVRVKVRGGRLKYELFIAKFYLQFTLVMMMMNIVEEKRPRGKQAVSTRQRSSELNCVFLYNQIGFLHM